MRLAGIGFRPRLIPTLFTILAVLLCSSLGAWQVQRLHWKHGLIAAREAALAAPPIDLRENRAPAASLEFHHVIAQGTFLNDKEAHVHTINPQGDPGFDVLTPLREESGQVVLVDRGFVPTPLEAPATRAAGEPVGPARVGGLLRVAPSRKPGWFIPDNRPQTGEWFWIDLPTIAATLGVPGAAPYYVQADAAPNPGGWPKGGGSDPLALPDNHLQYAITWFALAVAALVIFVLAQRRGAPHASG
ncbi:MAG: SURF1 family protein [Alphaproteobacteria bacterium]|nr:SURF1 family protein [Alphaproteobacteria bacterium]